MTGDEMRQARHTLGQRWNNGQPLSQRQLAAFLRLSAKNGERSVRDMEQGNQVVSGPISVAIEAMLAGFMPTTQLTGERVGTGLYTFKPPHLMDDREFAESREATDHRQPDKPDRCEGCGEDTIIVKVGNGEDAEWLCIGCYGGMTNETSNG